MSDAGETDPWGNPLPTRPPTPTPPPGWAPPPGGTYSPAVPPRTEGTAIGSLVCGLVGLLICGIILEPVAIVLGLQARRKIRSSGGVLKGEGLATAGIIIGIVGLVLAIVGVILVMRDPDLLKNFLTTTTTTGG